jgi:predicted transglutaminase-like cysteine proteinase
VQSKQDNTPVGPRKDDQMKAAALFGFTLLCSLHLPAMHPQMPAWRTELERLRTATELQQVAAVNQLVNLTLRISDDHSLWGHADYWATPEESLARGQGDCEDFAIAKFFLLRALGVEEQRLWLVYAVVRLGAPGSRIRREHMVLSYTPPSQGETLILDNMLTDILPLAQRQDLIPAFRFNTRRIEMRGAFYPLSLLPHWQALLGRMRQPGGSEPHRLLQRLAR